MSDLIQLGGNIPGWESHYKTAESDDTLWGDQPVPFVEEAARSLAKESRCSKALDFPCGDGRNLPTLAAYFPAVIGVDGSRNALELAHSRIRAKSCLNCILCEGNLFGSLLVSNQFDVVLCWDVLGHIKDAHLAVGELLRLCRPGGVIVASFFALEDSTRGQNMESIGHEEFIYQNEFYFRFRSKSEVCTEFAELPVRTRSVSLVRWVEPPHLGYREYEHEHASWAAIIEKI